MAIVDDVKEGVGSIETVGKIADFIDDKHVRLEIVQQAVAQATVATGGG